MDSLQGSNSAASPIRNPPADAGPKLALVVLSQKVARFEFENQIFEKIQD
jgi:hypothetical protein